MLRISLIVGALILVFDAGLFSPVTKELSDQTYSYLASVGAGMFASIPPNEINTLTAELSAQQRNLDAREAALEEREIAARSFATDTPDYSLYIISTILFIITVLLVLNYAMDWARVRQYPKIAYEK